MELQPEVLVAENHKKQNTWIPAQEHCRDDVVFGRAGWNCSLKC
ncbi:hypothetical protein [Shewanella inventionis]|nr:hypothetical protein [Shewanella inventionis]